MKAFSRAIDKFCYRHPNFGIRNLMLYIVIGNASVYLISAMDRTGTFLSFLVFSPAHILRGEIWRLVTFLLIPTAGSLFFAAIMLYFYYFIGSTLEHEWGCGRFTLYYFSGVIFFIVYGFLFWLLRGYSPYLDASYLNFSMFFAFALMFPDTRVLLFFFIPIKMKWLALVNALLFIWWTAAGDLLPLVAVLNLFLFCGEFVFKLIRSSAGNARTASRFRNAARSAKHEAENKPYRHKCAVCGKTDTDYPGLDFRYCSRCEGYRCFCEEHINSHVHFKEIR